MNTEKINKDAVMYNMKLIRELTGLSMGEFGKKTGNLSKDQIASYEAGRALPQEPTIHRVCELAGISRHELMSEKLMKEDVVKEMFNVLSINTTDNSQDTKTLVELRKVIEVMQMTINAQARMLEMQNEITATFRELAKRS